MNFGAVAVRDTEAVAQVAAAIVAEHERGVNVVAVLPPYAGAVAELEELASSISPAPQRRELDMLVSSSASMSGALCAMAIHRRGCRAVSLEAAQAGIVTDTTHTRAKLLEVQSGRIARELGSHGIVLVSGVIGVARETNDLTALGPGGPDAVAQKLASALHADACLVAEPAR